NIVKEDLVNITLADETRDLPNQNTGRIHRQQKDGNALASGSRAGQQEAGIGVTGVGGPDLLAVDTVTGAVLLGPRTQRGEVGARLRLRESLAPEGLAARHRWDVTLLLLRRAVAHQCWPDPIHIHVLAATRLAGLPHLLGENEGGPGIGIPTTPRARPVRDQQAGLGKLGTELPGESALRFRAGTVSERLPIARQMGGEECAHTGAECLLLRVPLEIHKSSSLPRPCVV